MADYQGTATGQQIDDAVIKIQNLEQTTGFAADKIMSQKAVTDSLLADDITEDSTNRTKINSTTATFSTQSNITRIDSHSDSSSYGNAVYIGGGPSGNGASKSVAVGYDSSVYTNSVAIGNVAAATKNHAVAVGSEAEAMQNSVAIGYQTKAKVDGSDKGAWSVSIGSRSKVQENNSVGVGDNTSVLSTYSVALGNASQVPADCTYSVAIGASSKVTEPGTVSVGNGNPIVPNYGLRRIVNVKDPVNDQDATTKKYVDSIVSDIYIDELKHTSDTAGILGRSLNDVKYNSRHGYFYGVSSNNFSYSTDSSDTVWTPLTALPSSAVNSQARSAIVYDSASNKDYLIQLQGLQSNSVSSAIYTISYFQNIGTATEPVWTSGTVSSITPTDITGKYLDVFNVDENVIIVSQYGVYTLTGFANGETATFSTVLTPTGKVSNATQSKDGSIVLCTESGYIYKSDTTGLIFTTFDTSSLELNGYSSVAYSVDSDCYLAITRSPSNAYRYKLSNSDTWTKVSGIMGFTNLNALEYGSKIGIFTSNDDIPKETRIYSTTNPFNSPLNWDCKIIGSLYIGQYRAFAFNDSTQLFTSEFNSSTVEYFQKARVLSIESGGTGAATAEEAKINLGITSPKFGTFTPVFGSSATQPNVVYTEQSGVYWKIGNLCIASGRITCDIGSAGTGYARLTGLPFVSSKDIEAQNVIFSEQYNVFSTTTTDLAGKIEANTNYITMGRYGSWTVGWGTAGMCFNFVAIYQTA